MLNLVKQETTQTIVTLHWTPLFMALNLAIKIDELEHDAEMSLEPFGLGKLPSYPLLVDSNLNLLICLSTLI